MREEKQAAPGQSASFTLFTSQELPAGVVPTSASSGGARWEGEVTGAKKFRRLPSSQLGLLAEQPSAGSSLQLPPRLQSSSRLRSSGSPEPSASA
ncbi:hypothetical protein J2T17_001767 [Paenibacillus mucilaginosus]|uniref:hypothetical protein n=1 Tax=Paenibacillus mucilaginosus TaxID=61624 RepID=UPI003D246F03